MKTLTFCILIFTLACSAGSQTARTISDTPRALVTEVDLTEKTPYTLSGGKYGAVLVALSDGISIQDSSKPALQAGATDEIRPGLTIHVIAKSAGARIIVVSPKTTHQALTVEPFKLDHPMQDASDRNDTLLIAIQASLLTDSHAHKAQTISLKPGEVKWIDPGVHMFKNIGPDIATLVSIEW